MHQKKTIYTRQNRPTKETYTHEKGPKYIECVRYEFMTHCQHTSGSTTWYEFYIYIYIYWYDFFQMHTCVYIETETERSSTCPVNGWCTRSAVAVCCSMLQCVAVLPVW